MNIIFILKRITLILMCLFFGNILYAQSIEVTIKDIKTDEVIPSVYIKAIKQNEKIETISNLDGKIKLPIKCDSIMFSHVSYEYQFIGGNLDEKNVVYLIPKTVVLDEITIYSIDLKKKFEHVLKNFSRLYISGQHTYQCTYKDTYRVNDSLTRLSQIQLK